MTYLGIINQVASVFPVLMVGLTVLFLIGEYKNEGTVSISRNLMFASFCFYLLCCYALVILPLPSFEEALEISGPYTDFRLFGFVTDFFTYTSGMGLYEKLTSSWFYLPFFNFLMLIPFGMYERKFFGNGLGTTLFWAMLLSLSFELLQLTGLLFIYLNPYRLFQLDDLLLNVAGALVGFLLVPTKVPKRKRVDLQARTGFKDRVLSLLLDLVILSLMSRFLKWFFPAQGPLGSYLVYAVSVGLYTLITLREGRRLSGYLTSQSFTGRNGSSPKAAALFLREGLLFLFVLPAPVLGIYLMVSGPAYRILLGLALVIVFVLTLFQTLTAVPFYESVSGVYLTELRSRRASLSSCARSRREAQNVPPKTSRPRVRPRAQGSRERK